MAMQRHIYLALGLVGFLCGCSSVSPDISNSGVKVYKITADFSNSYLVTNGANSFLIDAGSEVKGAWLANEISELGIDPASLRAVVLTHGHVDHAGGAGYLKSTFKIPVIAGAGDASMLRSGRNDTLCPRGWYAHRLHDDAQSASFAGLELDVPVSAPFDLSASTGISASIQMLPGHTDGSLIIKVDNFAFVGDLLRGGMLQQTQANLHFFMCDLEENRDNLRKLLATVVPEAERFYLGHMGPVNRESIEALITHYPDPSSPQ